MIRAVFHALVSHWARQPLQGLTLVLGLALATALFSGVQAINGEAKAAYSQAASAVSGPGTVLERADGTPISTAEYVALRRAGWLVSPVLEGSLRLPSGRIRLVGIDPLSAPAGSRAAQAALSEGETPGDPAAFIRPPGLLLASPSTAGRIEPTGLSARLQAVDGLAPGLVFADIGIVQTLLERPGEISRLILADRQPAGLPAPDKIVPGLVRIEAETTSDLARLTESFHLNLTAFGLLSFAVGLFIVHATIGLAFEQRRTMFRTIRALGVPAGTLVIALVLELAIVALLAGGLGTGLGYLMAAALLPDVAATLSGLYGASLEGGLTFRPSWALAGLGIAVLGTGAAALGGLLRILRLPVLAPALPRAWLSASDRHIRAQAALAIGLTALSGLGILFGSGVVAGFVTLGALMLGAACALPLFLRAVLSVLGRTVGTVRRDWFLADTRQQVPGLSLALMALLLALATNIGVGTMVSSFRLTFTGWLDQRLASELYLRAQDADQAADVTAWLASRVEAILPIASFEARILGQDMQVFGVADHATYRDHWPLIAATRDVWTDVADGSAVLINEQLSLREALGPGDSIGLPGGWQAAIGGVYSDYGNPRGQVMIGIKQMRARYPETAFTQFALRLPPDQVADLSRDLVDRFDLNPEAVVDQQSIKSFSLAVFERTFTVTAALNVLTLSVAGFAILTSLLTLSAIRLPQLAPVWALGMTQGELARLELLRAVFLATLTLVVALPLGLALAWVLLNVVNVEAFGWRLPMHLFPQDWLALGLLAILAAALASLWPALRLYRMQPSELVKVFAHER